MNDRPLAGRTALVTGGAKGIGRACCLRLAQAGANVAINYLTSEREARETAESVRQAGVRSHRSQGATASVAACAAQFSS